MQLVTGIDIEDEVGFTPQMVNPTSDYSANTIEASDGLPALVVGHWWKEKHHYIRRYQEIFRKSMSDKWPHRVYADLFAGPGRCVIERSQEEIDGSPVVAMAADKPFTECYFADESGDFIEALKQRVRGRGEAQFFIGDANVVVDDVVSQLPDKQSSLGLAFLDPFGYELDFRTIGKLTAGRRMDLMITFHTGYLRRFAEKNPNAFNDFFGRKSWFEEYREQRKTHRRVRSLLNVYESGLTRLGYQLDNIDDEILVEDGRRLLYHLIFASKHPRGKEFWHKISRKSSAGQQRLF